MTDRSPSTDAHPDPHQHGEPAGELPPGWSRPQPEYIPQPTYWPAVMGLGVTCVFWGVVTTWFISLVGLALFVLALAGWIGDLTHGE